MGESVETKNEYHMAELKSGKLSFNSLCKYVTAASQLTRNQDGAAPSTGKLVLLRN